MVNRTSALMFQRVALKQLNFVLKYLSLKLTIMEVATLSDFLLSLWVGWVSFVICFCEL